MDRKGRADGDDGRDVSDGPSPPSPPLWVREDDGKNGELRAETFRIAGLSEVRELFPYEGHRGTSTHLR